MQIPGLNLTVVRYVAFTAAAAIFLSLVAVLLVLLLRGVPPTAPSIIGLISYLGTLVGLLTTLIGTGVLAGATSQTQQWMNGHQQAHLGHTDQQINSMIDARLAGKQAAASPLVDRPPEGDGEQQC